MIRTLFTLAVVALLATGVGCRMCAHPHDYSGPVLSGACGSPCVPCDRAGSILTGMPMGAAMETEIPSGELVPTPDAQSGPALSVPRQTLERRAIYSSAGAPVDMRRR